MTANEFEDLPPAVAEALVGQLALAVSAQLEEPLSEVAEDEVALHAEDGVDEDLMYRFLDVASGRMARALDRAVIELIREFGRRSSLIVDFGHAEYDLPELRGVTVVDILGSDPDVDLFDLDDEQLAALFREKTGQEPDEAWDLTWQKIQQVSWSDDRQLLRALDLFLDDLDQNPGGDDGTFDYWPSGMRAALQLDAALGNVRSERIKEIAERIINMKHPAIREEIRERVFQMVSTPTPRALEAMSLWQRQFDEVPCVGNIADPHDVASLYLLEVHGLADDQPMGPDLRFIEKEVETAAVALTALLTFCAPTETDEETA